MLADFSEASQGAVLTINLLPRKKSEKARGERDEKRSSAMKGAEALPKEGPALVGLSEKAAQVDDVEPVGEGEWEVQGIAPPVLRCKSSRMLLWLVRGMGKQRQAPEALKRVEAGV